MNKQYNKSILQSVLLNNTIFNEITNSSLSKIEYIYLSSNPNLNDKQIECLFLQKIDNVNINLLRNDNCSQKRINEFLQLNDKIYNIAIAHNKSLSKETIQKLIDINDPDITMSLKFNNLL